MTKEVASFGKLQKWQGALHSPCKDVSDRYKSYDQVADHLDQQRKIRT